MRPTARICSCGDCCGVLRSLQALPKPSEAVASGYLVHFDPAGCSGCGLYTERCQMQAISPGEPVVRVNTDRCIGCGLCVSTCPEGALSLVRKPPAAIKETPETIQDMWATISRSQSRQDS